jgi:hypothetical protein
MELENKAPVGETGNRRKSFLEKLGLVEPVLDEDASLAVPSTAVKAEIPQSPASIHSLFAEDSEPESTAGIPAEPALAVGFEPSADMSRPALFDEPEQTFTAPASPSPGPSGTGASDYQSAVASQKNIQMLTVAEIYTLFNLKPAAARETVYLIENFLQALPVNLPYEVKRDSLHKLLKASSFDPDQLASDGRERIHTLERYLDGFTQDLEDVIAHNEAQVAELKERIRMHTEMISEKTRMIAEQKSLVKFEAQRIASLLDSVEKGN